MTLTPAVRAPAVAMPFKLDARIDRGRAGFRQSRLELAARPGPEGGRPDGGTDAGSRCGARSGPLQVLILFMKIEFVLPKRR